LKLNVVVSLTLSSRERTARAETSHENHHGRGSWHMFQLNLSQLQLLLRSEPLDIQISSSLDIASEKDALLEFWTGADAETAPCLSPPL
jgi:hypothetical protein